MKGVYMQWSEIIEEFTFAVIHAKVVVEDCISREPRHLLDPTKEDHQLEQEYKSEPGTNPRSQNYSKERSVPSKETQNDVATGRQNRTSYKHESCQTNIENGTVPPTTVTVPGGG